uniref:E3 ubiquitin-protein ligase n=1 Tax=Callorhinchus milii TaxID=7868 RepID=A0A4W3KE75_CALMI
SVVYRHLSEYVPSIRCVVSVAKCPEEEQGHQMLLRTMEWFLFGEAPEDGFAKLQENKSSSQLCGRVFKGGETTYSCRDCAIDPTCVLCMDCFQSSVHRNHRYKMNCSYGGGLCDCGDVEAWKTGPFCTKHEPGLSEDIVNHASQIPAGVAERAQHLFDIIFRYLVDMLIWTENKGLPLELEKTDSYFCMLFNDEDHSVDHVIHSLQKSLGCSTKEAENYTWMVDKEGRRVIKHGTLQSCQETKQEVFNNTNSVFQSPLRVEILHSTIVSHQTFACRLLSWLNHMIGYSAGLRQIFCDLALQQVPASDQPCFISRLMLSDVKLWKGARKAFHELIVCSLLMEAEYKRLFAIEFIKHYKQLQLESVEDDQDRNISVTALSVQIFTVPTLARHLIEEHDALKIITETIIELWSDAAHTAFTTLVKGCELKISFLSEIVMFLSLVYRYVLISKPPLWTDRRRDRFLEGFNIFLRLLKSIQGMEPVCRQFGQHVEIEPDWEPAFTVQMFLKFILLMMQEWCASDEQVLLRAYKECHSVLSQCSNELIHCNTKKQSATLNLCGHSVSCVVSREPISIHLPLSRLLAGLHAHLSRSGAIDKLEQYVPSVSKKLMEYPLRCLVLVSQVSADMWRRNGFSLVNQVFYFHNTTHYDKGSDFFLCIGASLMDPNHFLMLVLNKFELFEDFTKHSIPKSKDEIKQNVSLLEEFLHLIIMVVGERHVPGIGRVTKEEVTMREVIHLLSIESMAHSSLVKALPENESNETGLEKVIHEVATFKKPGLSGHGVYELKPECLKEFNLYFYHYDKSQQTKVNPFVPAFAKITSILNCDVFMLILRTVCQQAVSSKGQLWSEAMIQKAVQDKDKAERKRKAEAAKLHRQKIMAQMSAMQKNFIESNKHLYEKATEVSTTAVEDSGVALGPKQGAVAAEKIILTCILCQEEQEVRVDGMAMVLTACVQRSTALTQNTCQNCDPLFMHPDLGCGTHAGSCGHVMHASCWQKYFEAVQNSTRHRLHADLSFHLDNVEYLCPLCKSLCNAVIPVLPLQAHSLNRYAQVSAHYMNKKKHSFFHFPLDSFGPHFHSFPPLKFSDSIVKMLMLFAMAVHREGLKVSTNEADVRVPVMVWGACAFTIQSIENNLSEESKPLFGSLPDRQVLSVLAFPSLYWEETVELQPSDISSTFNNLYLFHLITMAHIVQILFTSTSGQYQNCEEAQSAVKLYEKLRKYTSGALESKPHGWYLWNCVKCGITPFLRSSALFFNYLLGVPPSKDLWKGQFEALCYYFLFVLHGIENVLTILPIFYNRCPHSTDDETRNAVLCMFCGTMICSQSQCCQQQVDGKKLGGCSAHAVKCGSGLGIFLRIKECQVLLLAGKNRGCFVPAPYLDDYGETDQLLKRGNPLHLCPDRYRKLQQMWRQHRILEEIARNQDANHMAFAVDWHEF